MAEPIKISTGKYTKDGKVDVDGKIWTVQLIGVATDMKLRQAQRWLTLLQNKIDNGIATEEDLDKYDEYDKVQYEVFVGMFKDDTPDNAEVRAWVAETPLPVLIAAFNDLSDQTADTLKGTSDESKAEDTQSS